MSAKCPIGGIGRRSSTRTPLRVAQSLSRLNGNSGRQPSLRATGAKHCSNSAARAAFRADMIDQHDLAARLEHARKLVERRFRVGHRGDDILRHHDVEGVVGQRHAGGVHHRDRFDVGQFLFDHALMRLAQHGLGDIDADDAIDARVAGQRNAGADADFQNAPAGGAAELLRRRDRFLPSALEHRAEHQVIDRRPARIGAFHALLVDIAPHDEGYPGAAAAALAVSARNAALAATALLMKPPPSTRAWPMPAS